MPQLSHACAAGSSDLVWQNLLEPIARGGFPSARVAQPLDRDYLVLVMQLRRYLDGDLSEAKIRSLQRKEIRRMQFPGVLAYFPLVDYGSSN